MAADKRYSFNLGRWSKWGSAGAPPAAQDPPSHEIGPSYLFGEFLLLWDMSPKIATSGRASKPNKIILPSVE